MTITKREKSTTDLVHPTLEELRSLPNTHDFINLELEIDRVKNPVLKFLYRKRFHWGLYSGDYLLIGKERYIYNGIIIGLLLTVVLGIIRSFLFIWRFIKG